MRHWYQAMYQVHYVCWSPLCGAAHNSELLVRELVSPFLALIWHQVSPAAGTRRRGWGSRGSCQKGKPKGKSDAFILRHVLRTSEGEAGEARPGRPRAGTVCRIQ